MNPTLAKDANISPDSSQTEVAAREVAARLDSARTAALALERQINTAIVGQPRAVRLITIAIMARGHVLLEGDVGVGKTTLLRAAARALGGAYERIEGTIDLMPSDMIYHTYLNEDGKPRVEPGPILRHGEDLSIFFFNEINRARPQVHSLLLRLMAERTLTAFNSEYAFPNVLLFADRNKIEREETFELPAAARDRFMMEISISAPKAFETQRALTFDPRFHDVDALIDGLQGGVVDYRGLNDLSKDVQRSITVSPTLEKYVIDISNAVRNPAEAGISFPGIAMDRLVAGGMSPRGMSYLVRAARVAAWLKGRDMVVPEDLREIFRETMAHRIFLDPIYEIRRAELVERLIAEAFDRIAAP